MFAKWYHKIVTLPCQCDGHYAKVETERLKDPNKLKWKNSRDISISTKRAKSTRFFTLNELSCLDTSSNALTTLFENFALNLCQLPPAFFLFVQPFLSLTASEKAETLLQNTILYERAACPGARRQHYEREHGPWLFSWGPGQSRAKVVITERLIADRTFQQPVVNWMELRGRKHQMHRPDRCSADDFRVVRGMHAILLYSFFF